MLTAYFFVVPKLVNIDKYRLNIEKFAVKSIHLPVSFGHLDTSMTWNLGIIINSKSIEVKHSDGKEFIKTGQASLEIPLLPLLHKKVFINNIRINSAKAYVTRMQNGKFDIEQLFPKRKIQPKQYKLQLENTKILVKNYQLYFRDKAIKPHQNYVFWGDKLKITGLVRNKPVKIFAKARMLKTNKAYNSNILFQGILTKNNLIIKKLSVKNKKLKAVLSGNINDFSSKKTIINLNLSVDNSRIMQILQLFPKELKIPFNAVEKLSKHNMDGNIWTVLKIKGTCHKPLLCGYIKINDVSLTQGQYKFSKINANIDFSGKTLTLNVKSPVGAKELILTRGTISPLLNRINLNVSSNAMNLASAQALLFVVRGIFNFPLGPVSLMTVAGHGKINLTISSILKNPSLFGILNIDSASVRYKELSGIARNVNGTIRFNDDKVLFDNIKGIINGSKTVLNGNTTLKGLVNIKLIFSKLDLSTGHKIISDSPLLISVKQTLKNIKAVSGIADVTINLKGTPQKLNSSGNLKIYKAMLDYVGVSQLMTNISGLLSFKNTFLFFHQVKGNIAQSPIIINGNVINGDKVNIILTSSKLNLGKTKKLIFESPALFAAREPLQGFNTLSGYAAVKLELLGSIKQNNEFKNLQLLMKKAYFKHKEFDFPVNLQTGRIIITPALITMNKLNSNIANSKFYLNGSVKNYNTEPIYNILLSAHINSRDIEKYANSFLDEPLIVTGIIPVKAKFIGNQNNWSLKTRAIFNKGIDLYYNEEILGLPKEKTRVISLKANGTRNTINISDFNIFMGDAPISDNLSELNLSEAGFQRFVNINGTIDKLQTNPVFKNM